MENKSKKIFYFTNILNKTYFIKDIVTLETKELELDKWQVLVPTWNYIQNENGRQFYDSDQYRIISESEYYKWTHLESCF